MTQPIRMIIDNRHDTASLTATSEAMPISYTQRSGRSYVWRSANLNQQVITGTLETPDYLSSLVIYGHNLTPGGTVRLQYLVGNSVTYDTGAVPASSIIPLSIWQAGIDPWGAQDVTELPNTQLTLWTPARLAERYRITINDPNPPEGYIEIQRIATGLYYSPQLTSNVSYGVELEWQDLSENRRTESGSLRTIGKGEARRVTFSLDHLPKDEQTRLTRELLRVDKGRDVYISIYPEAGGMLEAEHAFMARRESNYSHQHTRFNNWASQHTFQEV